MSRSTRRGHAVPLRLATGHLSGAVAGRRAEPVVLAPLADQRFVATPAGSLRRARGGQAVVLHTTPAPAGDVASTDRRAIGERPARHRRIAQVVARRERAGQVGLRPIAGAVPPVVGQTLALTTTRTGNLTAKAGRKAVHVGRRTGAANRTRAAAATGSRRAPGSRSPRAHRARAARGPARGGGVRGSGAPGAAAGALSRVAGRIATAACSQHQRCYETSSARHDRSVPLATHPPTPHRSPPPGACPRSPNAPRCSSALELMLRGRRVGDAELPTPVARSRARRRRRAPRSPPRA